MNNRRKVGYWERAGGEGWLEASAQFPVLLPIRPRQVGKTTLLRHLSDGNRRYVTMDDLAARDMARDGIGHGGGGRSRRGMKPAEQIRGELELKKK
mgnify:CR=1 FL=1